MSAMVLRSFAPEWDSDVHGFSGESPLLGGFMRIANAGLGLGYRMCGCAIVFRRVKKQEN